MDTKKETWLFPIFTYPGRDRIFCIRAKLFQGFGYQIFCLDMIFVIKVRWLSYVKCGYSVEEDIELVVLAPVVVPEMDDVDLDEDEEPDGSRRDW